MPEFVIRGTRGTMPASGPRYIRYGGNTTCFSVHTDGGLIIIDAGTGISHVVSELARASTNPSITLLFSHFHVDHILGLPYFDPLYQRKTHLTIMADASRKEDWRKTIRTFIGEPYWPIGFGESDAIMDLCDLPNGEASMELHGVRISWCDVPHPQRCLAYRVDMPDKTIVIATDAEYAPDTLPQSFMDFCKGTDVLIFDAQYTPEEYAHRQGWGHSTWETAVTAATRLNASRLILTHHDPRRKDEEIDRIVETASRVFPQTIAAYENMVL